MNAYKPIHQTVTLILKKKNQFRGHLRKKGFLYTANSIDHTKNNKLHTKNLTIKLKKREHGGNESLKEVVDGFWSRSSADWLR